MPKLILIDSHALIHRAYHALPPLITKKGEVVGAVYGFSSLLIKIIKEMRPDYLVAAFDRPEPTFRHEEYKEYKAQRPPTPSDLESQFVVVKDVLRAFSIPVLEKSGYEADDIIGAIAQKIKKEKPNIEIIILSGDLDLLQLVDSNVSVLALKKGISETILYDLKAIKLRYDLLPEELVDYKALVGDPSDNIPGVRGIGPKRATELVKKYGPVENMKDFLKEEEYKIALFSKKLTKINRDVPMEFDLEKARFSLTVTTKIKEIFHELGFKTLMARLEPQKTLFEINQEKMAGQKNNGLKNEFRPLGSENIQDFANTAKKRGNLLIIYDEKEAEFFVSADNQNFFQLDKNNATFDKRVLEIIWPLLKDEKIEKWGWDLKPFLKIIMKPNEPSNDFLSWLDKNRFIDLKIVAWLLDSGRRSYNLKEILSFETGQETYEGLLILKNIFLANIKKLGLEKVFFEIETPLIPILAKMENRGISVNQKQLAQMAQKFEKETADLKNKIFYLAGGNFNPNSGRELKEVLFERLKISKAGLKKTPKGEISVAADELLKLEQAHPIVPLMLKLRELTKLKSTYIDPLPDLIDKKDNRIHTAFFQTGTATGRLSSASPNLQNLPARSEFSKDIRSIFEASPGFEFAAFDYSQLELRIIASLANDEKMIAAFKKNEDIHVRVAAEINNVPVEKVSGQMRQAAKALNFGLIYGMGILGFAKSAGISREEAESFMAEYFADFAGLAHYIEFFKEEARKNGLARTVFGRVRFLPEINSPRENLRKEAERMAVNMSVQGLAADIMKLGMNKIEQQLGGSEEVFLILQIHDELVFEIKSDKIKENVAIIKNIMENIYDLKSGLKVDIESGNNLGNLKSVNI
ncbi:MAG: DNA polymerase I [Parcubacteria group bacterium]|nr:DNA polymerase I [Parcubacteria group bacterium]